MRNSSLVEQRKYDNHTGVDLYCLDGDEVYAIEDGVIVNIEKFTGEWVGSHWWNNTEAILVEGESGVILYGEVEIFKSIINGLNVKRGDLLGYVKRVLKKDKGIIPTSMLHIELYKHGTRESVWWGLGKNKPENLLDITNLLKEIIN